MNSTLNSKHQRQRSGFRQVDPVIAEAMKAVVSEHVNERRSAQLGLSYNIWCKIRSGQPIRSSLPAGSRLMRAANCGLKR